MKKSLFFVASCLLLDVSLSQAQSVPQCGSDKAKDYFIKNLPGYKEQLEIANAKNAQEFQAYKVRLDAERASANKSATANSATYTYTIPVVFHVLHTNGPENVSDASCIAALAEVNKDYAKQGADTNTIDPLYAPLYVNSHMHFVLAKKDPSGNCTTGIVHHYDENTQWKQSNLYNYKYSTVGTFNWSPSRYLNIYVVDNIIGDIQDGLGIGGYTYKPGTAPNVGSDAIVLSLNLLLSPASRGLSHEIGHWFGLSHVFDGNGGFRLSPKETTALNVGYRCGNDDIADTPKTPGFVSICPNYLTLLDSCDPGKRPNIHNIMDYASCPKMFTQGQTDKMRFSASSATANRNYLVDTTNLVFTGIYNKNIVSIDINTNDTVFAYTVAPLTTCAPIADFYANKAKSCQGQTVLYNSTSYNNTTGLTYSWNFDGGAPATSTLATPSVTYSVPGNYSTTLTITNAAGTSTKVRAPFMNTSWHVDQIAYPSMESFENVSYLLPVGWTAINKDYGSLTWQLANYGSQGSGKCMILPNANGMGNVFPSGNVDILETNQFNFNNTTAITVSYDYSYARKPSTPADDVFKFEYSTDCGGTWSTMPSTPTASLLAQSGGTVTAPYIPYSQSKWVTKTYPSTAIGILNGKSDVKFRFWFQNDATATAQNFYIDNFNITGTVGLDELENTIGLSIYPNPTTASSTLEFTSPVNVKMNVTVIDVMGRIVEENNFDATAGALTKYSVNKNATLKAGIYFVSLSLNNQKITKKLIIE